MCDFGWDEKSLHSVIGFWDLIDNNKKEQCELLGFMFLIIKYLIPNVC